MKRIFVFIIVILFGDIALAANGEKFKIDGKAFETESIQKTKMGQLKVVVETETRERAIYLDSKLIYPSKQSDESSEGWYNLEHIYYIGNNMVILVNNTEGAQYGIDKFFFLTITPNKSVVVSESFPANKAKDTQVVTVAGNQVIVGDMDFPVDSTNTELYRKVVYQNGAVTIFKSKPTDQEKMTSCQSLYIGYQNYISTSCQKGYDGVCLEDAVSCGEYLDSGIYKRVHQATILTCRNKKPMTLSGFKSQVCKLK